MAATITEATTTTIVEVADGNPHEYNLLTDPKLEDPLETSRSGSGLLIIKSGTGLVIITQLHYNYLIKNVTNWRYPHAAQYLEIFI